MFGCNFWFTGKNWDLSQPSHPDFRNCVGRLPLVCSLGDRLTPHWKGHFIGWQWHLLCILSSSCQIDHTIMSASYQLWLKYYLMREMASDLHHFDPKQRDPNDNHSSQGRSCDCKYTRYRNVRLCWRSILSSWSLWSHKFLRDYQPGFLTVVDSIQSNPSSK